MRRSDFYKILAEVEMAIGQHRDDNLFQRELSFIHSRLYMEGVRRDLSLVSRHLKIGKLLDFGCGTGVISALCSRLGFDVHGVEIPPEVPNISGASSQEEWEQRSKIGQKIRGSLEARFGVNFELYDGKNLPYPENSFDGVLAYAVIEHIADELLQNAIREVSKVLKPNGFFFILRTPRAKSYTERIFHSHRKSMSERELILLLKSSNFETITCDRTDFFPQFMPGSYQKLVNLLTPPLYLVQSIFDRFPITNYVCHNMRIAARNVSC